MKSLKDIKLEISDQEEAIAEERSYAAPSKPKISRAKKRLQFLKTVYMYIESGPDPDFLRKEIKRLDYRIKAIIDLCPDFSELSNVNLKKAKEMKVKYEKDNDIPRLKEQARTIRYILN
jgi:hypothetical protein